MSNRQYYVYKDHYSIFYLDINHSLIHSKYFASGDFHRNRLAGKFEIKKNKI